MPVLPDIYSVPSINLGPERHDMVEVLLGICEGQIKGVHNGLQSIYINGTPIQSGSGQYNFKNLDLEVYTGVSSPSNVNMYLGGQATTTNVTTTLYSQVAVQRTTTTGAIDRIAVRVLINALYRVGSSGAESQYIDFDIKYKAHSASTWTEFPGSPYHMKVLVQTPTVYEFLVDVPQISEPYDISVTKTSVEGSPSNQYVSNASWESFQQIVKAPVNYPNTALLHLYVPSTNQFSTLTEVKAIYDGMLCRIPSNYDPIARTYTGTWDGTFKVDWTNNPAFILQEAVLNTRWGMNAYYPANIDKYDIYDAAQWCDTVVNGQPQFTFNAYIQDAQPGIDFCRYIAGSFGGTVFDDQNGNILLKVDMANQPAVALFTPENIENGLFQYSYTDLNQRYNQVQVQFINASYNYVQDTREINDTADQAINGIVPYQMIAAGCTDLNEAMRRAYYRLISSMTECEQVTFKTNRLAASLLPFDIILVADADMGYALTGRIASISTDRLTAYLRDPIYLETGVAYTLNFQTPAGVLTATLTGNATGNTTTLTFTTALDPNITPLTVFTVGGGSNYGLPKPYRILTIDMSDNSPDSFQITALEVNRNKWAGIYSQTFTTGQNYSDLRITNRVVAPSNLRLTTTASTVLGSLAEYRLLEWDATTDLWFKEYVIDYSYNGAPFKVLTQTKNTQADITSLPQGDYIFRVYAQNLESYSSDALVAAFSIGALNPTTDVPPMQGLQVNNQGLNSVFTTQDAHFSWRITNSQTLDLDAEEAIGGVETVTQDPLFKDFVITITDPNTGKVLLTDYTQNTYYDLSYQKNVSIGGPLRDFIFTAQYRDIYNRLSNAASLQVTNPAPAVPTNIQYTSLNGQTKLTWNPNTEPDLAGYMLWGSTNPSFTANASTLLYDGKDTSFVHLQPVGQVWYYVLAAYDVYDKTTYTLSSVINGTNIGLSLDAVANGTTNYSVQQFPLPNPTVTTWYRLGTWTFKQAPASSGFTLATGLGYNPNNNQHATCEIFFRSANDNGAGGNVAPNISGASYTINGAVVPINGLKLVASGSNTNGLGNTWDIYVEIAPYAGGTITFMPDSNNSFVFNPVATADPGVASSVVVVGTGGTVFNPVAGSGLDGIPDGTTYQRMPSANMSAARRALIDFRDTHQNATLQYMADGGGRYAAAQAGADKTSLNQSASVATIAGHYLSDLGGQLAGPNNQQPVTVGSFGSAWSGLSITYSSPANTGTATITAAGGTLVMGANRVTYSTASVGVSGTIPQTYTYYLYFNDPSYTGGAQTLYATTNPSDLTAANGYVYVGSCRITYSSTGGSGGGSSGGLSCVTLDTNLPGFENAAAVDVGALLELANPVTFETRKGKVSFATTEVAECIRLETESGITLCCSESAPIAVESGDCVQAVAILGQRIPVFDRGTWRIEKVTRVHPIGKRMVRHITCENDLFLAGEQPDRYVLHHNAKP